MRFYNAALHLVNEGQEAAPMVAAFFLLALFVAVVLPPRFKRMMRRRRVKQWADQQKDINALRRLSWQEFEIIAGEVFRRMGFQVEETGGGGPDGGADLILRKSGQKFLVSCKHYKGRVGAPKVREAVGAAVQHGAKGVYVVALSGFTSAAHKYGRRVRSVRLIDGDMLLKTLAKQKHTK